MTEERFVHLLTTFGNYCATRGKDPDTWGLFAALQLTHASSGHLGLSLQFCNPDGYCRDLSVLQDFLKLFDEVDPAPGAAAVSHHSTVPQGKTRHLVADHDPLLPRPWLDATIDDSGSGSSERAKYKSCYMKLNFTPDEARCIFHHLKRDVPAVDLRGSVLAVDTYCGATNRLELAGETAIWQRSSIMKLQFMSFWRDRADDVGRLQWMKDFYNDLYTGPNVAAQYASTPFPGMHYEGCYINYPDCDMLEHSFWPQLYYGTGDLYPLLQKVKRRYDPNNVFHHAMSIRA